MVVIAVSVGVSAAVLGVVAMSVLVARPTSARRGSPPKQNNCCHCRRQAGDDECAY